jgi:putative DNA primase/helicase
VSWLGSIGSLGRYTSALFEREIAAIQPGMAERSMLAEQIYAALGTTKADLKKTWGISTKEVAPPSSDIVDDVEAWPDPVDGLSLAEKMVTVLKRHVYAPEEVIHAIVLWTFLCDMAEDASILPIAGITSPTKRCGKTNLLICLARLCRKVLFASTISSAAVFRTIQEYMPTLFIDEADTFLPQNEELRGVINAGHTKGSYAIRCNQETNKPEKFSTFCPKAIAMIGVMPETIADRAINIRLERKPRSAHLVPVRKASVEEFIELARQKRRWIIDNVALICKAKPKVLALLNDRAAENWEILSQIAEVLGEMWPVRTTNASILLTPSDSDEQTDTIYLLVSLRKLFRDRDLNRAPKQRDVISSIDI